MIESRHLEKSIYSTRLERVLLTKKKLFDTFKKFKTLSKP